MAYKVCVGEDNGRTQALFDKLVDTHILYEIEKSSTGYMVMKTSSARGLLTEDEVERLCVKYFLTTNAIKLELHIDEYKVSFHTKGWHHHWQ